MSRILFHVALASVLSLGARAQNDCPNLRGVQKPARVDLAGAQICSAGLDGAFGANRTALRTNDCPLIVIVTPAHEEIGTGTGTFVRLLSTEKVVRLHFECESSWFLFIRLGSSCRFVREDTAGSVNHYGTYPCPDLRPELGAAAR